MRPSALRSRLLQASSSRVKALGRVRSCPGSRGARLAPNLVPTREARNSLTRPPHSASTARTSRLTPFCPTRRRTLSLRRGRMPPSNFRLSTVQTSTKCRMACNLSPFRASPFRIQAIPLPNRLSRATARSQWAQVPLPRGRRPPQLPGSRRLPSGLPPELEHLAALRVLFLVINWPLIDLFRIHYKELSI